MTESTNPPKSPPERLKRWLLEIRTVEAAGPEAREDRPEQHSSWQVACLTGVDYFSALGYIPTIAAFPACCSSSSLRVSNESRTSGRAAKLEKRQWDKGGPVAILCTLQQESGPFSSHVTQL